MLRSSSKQVIFSPDSTSKPTISGIKAREMSIAGSNKRVLGIFTIRLPKDSKFSPRSFFRRVSSKVAQALRLESVRRKSSGKVSSASLARSRSVAESVDSYRHRAEDIEDCIEFLNSSSSFSSLHRTSSVSACNC